MLYQLILLLQLTPTIFAASPASQLIQIACQRNGSLKFCQNTATTSTDTSIIAPRQADQFETELVFVSDYCVNNRVKYVDNCRSGQVLADIYQFCTSYTSACAGTDTVIPIVTYCQKYARRFRSVCISDREVVGEQAIQFCAAFSQFCYPEIYSKAAEMIADDDEELPLDPFPVMKRCDEVLHMARQVCNPFPSIADTFNTLRCTQFFKHCAKYVDWTTVTTTVAPNAGRRRNR